MSIDVNSPKITLAALFTLGTLVFYSGGLTYTVAKNSGTNEKQWAHINEKADKDSTEGLISAVNNLTIAVGSWKGKEERSTEDRLKTDAFMNKISREITDIKIKVTRIEVLQKKP